MWERLAVGDINSEDLQYLIGLHKEFVRSENRARVRGARHCPLCCLFVCHFSFIYLSLSFVIVSRWRRLMKNNSHLEGSNSNFRVSVS